MIEDILFGLEKNGYCYIPSLLGHESLERINEFIESQKSSFEAAKVGAKDQKQRVESIRGDFTYWLDPLSPAEPFSEIFQFLDSFKKSVNENFFTGIKQYECHLAYYPPGTFYHKHLDCFELDSSRRLSFVFYLNKDWKEEDDGEIVIYDKGGNILNTFYPMPGSFITFLSEDFPHEVKSSSRERRSLTGWMHNKIIY